jgi:nitrogen fixation protein NifX
MRVAFTSSDGTTVDLHFGETSRFHVWEVGPGEARFVETVTALTTGDEEDRTAARASAVAGCAIACTVQIGGPPAARLVGLRVHPMKTGAPVAIADVVARLQAVLRGAPPPWLRKAMARSEEPPRAGSIPAEGVEP